MRLSPAAELAMRGVLVLAREYGQGPVTLASMCEAGDMKRDYLARVMGMLARAELVEPVRGKRGGYELCRPPAAISMLEVIEAVEGPQHLNFCQSDPPDCSNAELCKVREVWCRLQKVFVQTLASQTLNELI